MQDAKRSAGRFDPEVETLLLGKSVAGKEKKEKKRKNSTTLPYIQSPYTAIYRLYMSPHTAIYVSACYYRISSALILLCGRMQTYADVYLAPSYCYISTTCVLILLYMCPHTTTSVAGKAFDLAGATLC